MNQAQQIKDLKAQIEALKSTIPTLKLDEKVTVKIGDKGTLNFYGLGRFPVCLYLTQVVKLAKAMNNPALVEFINQHNDKITKKAE